MTGYPDFPLPPLDDPAIGQFWRGAQDDNLCLPTDPAEGGRFVWYPPLDRDLDWVTIGGTGRLYSWAVVMRPIHPPLAVLDRYVAAIVTLDDAPGIRLVTRMIDPPETLKVDAPVHVTFRDLGWPHAVLGVKAPFFVQTER